jgi:hypothetical protein
MFPGVLVFPFPLREQFIGDTVMSVDVFGAINPQAGKLSKRQMAAISSRQRVKKSFLIERLERLLEAPD